MDHSQRHKFERQKARAKAKTKAVDDANAALFGGLPEVNPWEEFFGPPSNGGHEPDTPSVQRMDLRAGRGPYDESTQRLAAHIADLFQEKGWTADDLRRDLEERVADLPGI